ncbi:MAG: dTDP-glucose 4,6-dehydratase [Candidatus Peregrinibacteria bacterium GW2011_GWA2_33_10]|nr:MAG: dTDP-glucose 4,6-dehydratase [Candidatus Peregrinibacteria bacterium GW2011_GWA2_33_10]KKP41119.1 MAG: dTDP-glucose-4,6-dehydratase, RmlB, dTDP-glucose 4,6-dehydratase [Candidatus Peregrinibacteria bacterium GW2011_GWC2_33_13]OGJ49278.1 MAG: hypothetical protein A2229_05210 [Candidatus Peregrinibacteria bacterium RIFOXYA2_FULL_33_7]
MKILITGGAGFQGSHLSEYLSGKGHEITILNTWSENSERNINSFRNKIRVIWGSITDPEIVKKSIRGQDTVIHLAARINVDESISDPGSYIDVNVKGTLNILEGVKENDCRLIHASTCEVYGAPENKILIDERTELRPYSPYAASKAGADRLCFAYHKTFGTKVTIVRPFNIYGEKQKEGLGGALIAIFVKKALNGENLKVFGKGEQTRDYLHISDLVKAYELVLNNEDLIGETLNFGTGKETSIKDIAEFIASKMGSKVEFADARKGEVERFACDNTKAEKYGFNPSVDIWDGISKYIDWRKSLKS